MLTANFEATLVSGKNAESSPVADLSPMCYSCHTPSSLGRSPILKLVNSKGLRSQ